MAGSGTRCQRQARWPAAVRTLASPWCREGRLDGPVRRTSGCGPDPIRAARTDRLRSEAPVPVRRVDDERFVSS